MNKDLFLKITEAIKEELLDEEAVGIGMLRSVKGSIRRNLSTKTIMDTEDTNEKADLITKGAETYKELKSQFDSKKIKHSSFERMDDEMKKKALEYLGKRLEAFKIALEADEPSEIEAAKPVLDKFEKSDDTPTDVKDTPVEDMYDPSDEDREMLRSAYNNFKEEFYQVRKMVQQGQLIQLLINQLSKIQKEETEDSYQKVDEILNEEEKQRVKKELENVKTDFRSFYQELLSTRDLLQKAGKEAKAGKLNFNLVKKEFLQQLQKIQDDILEIYSDLVNLSPPKAEVEEIPESQQFLEQEGEQEGEKDDRLSRAKKIQAVYNEITKSIGPIVAVLSKGEPFPESRMLPAVATALEKLNKIVDFFPSVKAFSGQTGSFEELKEKYTNMIRDLGYLNDNFQRLVKDESVSSTAINNLYLGLKRFSKEMEDTFGVESKIIDKPKPTDPDAEAEDTGSDGEDNDGDGQTDEPGEEKKPEDEQEKEPVELKNMSSVNNWVRNKYLPIEDFLMYFKDNEDIEKSAEKVYDAFLTFIALSKFKQEVNEQDDDRTIAPASFSKIITLTSLIFDIPKEDAEETLDIMIKSFRQKAKELQNFYAIADRKELGYLAKLIRIRNKQYPFTISDLDKRSFVKNFLKSDEKSKKLAQRTSKARGKKQTSGKFDFGSLPATDYPGLPYKENKEQKLSKLLKPLIEKTLREQ